MNKVLMVVATLLFAGTLSAQINAKLMRYMDVSESQITFVYGGDIWLVPKSGGTAQQVTHSPGEEPVPRLTSQICRLCYPSNVP